MQKGVIAGYPVVGLNATLVDGSYHPVDSSEMAFKTAAAIAYREGIPQASPVLLEPIGYLKAHCARQTTPGDAMGELNKRRGRVLGMNPRGGRPHPGGGGGSHERDAGLHHPGAADAPTARATSP